MLGIQASEFGETSRGRVFSGEFEFCYLAAQSIFTHILVCVTYQFGYTMNYHIYHLVVFSFSF